MSKKGKPSAEATPPPPPPPTDTTAQDLLLLYARERSKKRLDLVEFTHAKYHDWLRFFGFAMEKELEWDKLNDQNQRSGRKHLRATIAMHRSASPQATPDAHSSIPLIGGAKTSKGASNGGYDASCPFASNAPSTHACWTLPPKLDAVDEFAIGLGPLPQATSVKAVVEQCIQPYKQVTWRLSEYACTHYKVRAIYRWLCEYIRCTPPQPKGSSGPSVTIQDPGSPPAAAKKPAAGAKGKGVQDAPPPPVATNPEDQAIISKTVEPLGMAQLFARMCEEAGVEVEVVKGSLKGVLDPIGKPQGFLPWAWNIVKAPDAEGQPRQYLVDVALSCCHMTPFDKRAGGGGVSSSPTPASPNVVPTTQATPATASGFTTAPTSTSGAAPPSFVDMPSGTKVFEPFYYFASPQQFGPLHFPEDQPKLLLQNLVTKSQWEASPRLNHEFYALGLSLDSHKRRCNFTIKSTPMYISVGVSELGTTDLICRVYKGQMTTIDLATAEPIDGKFVWQQRDEGNSGKVTFSIMMPDVGNYVVAIGGRSNKRMCGSTLPDEAYFPTVLMYQVLVNFVSVNDPMFPRQHLSPTIVKLLEPLRHKVLGGPQRFAVAPCVPNILAVGVVNRIFKTGAGNAGGPSSRVDIPAAPSTPTPRAGSSSVSKKPAAGGKGDKQVEAAAPVAAPPKPLAPEIERVQIELLPLNPKLCVFEGTVDLHIGLVELWVFFGDPASLCVGGAPSVTAHSDATASLQQVGDSSLNGSPAASPVPSAAAPPSPSPPKGVPTVLKPKGQFYPFVTEIQVVKRVPAKELALNEGRSLIQPLPAMERDRGAVLQLLTSVGVGEASHPRPVDDDGNARTIGTYFAGRQQQHQQSNTTKK